MALPIDEVHALDLLCFLLLIGLIDAQTVNPQQPRRSKVSDVNECFIQVQRDRDQLFSTVDFPGDTRVAPCIGQGRKVRSIWGGHAGERDLKDIALDPAVVITSDFLCETIWPAWRVDFEQANMVRTL